MEGNEGLNKALRYCHDNATCDRMRDTSLSLTTALKSHGALSAAQLKLLQKFYTTIHFSNQLQTIMPRVFKEV